MTLIMNVAYYSVHKILIAVCEHFLSRLFHFHLLSFRHYFFVVVIWFLGVETFTFTNFDFR